jgi:hypothetical protein
LKTQLLQAKLEAQQRAWRNKSWAPKYTNWSGGPTIYIYTLLNGSRGRTYTDRFPFPSWLGDQLPYVT